MPPSDSVVCVFGQNDAVMLYYASNNIFSRAVSHNQGTVVSLNLSDVTTDVADRCNRGSDLNQAKLQSSVVVDRRISNYVVVLV